MVKLFHEEKGSDAVESIVAKHKVLDHWMLCSWELSDFWPTQTGFFCALTESCAILRKNAVSK